MIMKDGAKTLESCLKSVIHIADEIIAVDTGSTDDSVSIARSFGAEVIRSRWTYDFSAARNSYLERARGDWILSLDCDECMDAVKGSELRQSLQEQPPTGFLFEIRNYFPRHKAPATLLPSRLRFDVGRETVCTVSRTIRLFHRDRRVRYRYPVHESLIPSLQEAGIRIRKCNIPIHHVHTAFDDDERRRKHALYRELGLKKIAEYPNVFVGYVEMGELLLRTGEFTDAEAMLRKAIQLRRRCWDAHLFLVLALRGQKRYSECRYRLSKLIPWREHDALKILSELGG